ncbi:MAG: sulfite exporter TauE/SafE family protein [Brachybacterium sp.]|nr:sulfite exporter TauE/SafE family protein [Brachybacterium sp.]
MEIALLAVLIGLLVGVVVGVLGAGGGILAVPVLVYLLDQSPHAATASSLVIVGLTALVSIIHRARAGQVAWRHGAVFAGLAVVGALVGGRLVAAVGPTLLMGLFGAMLGTVAVLMARHAVRTHRAERADGLGDAGGADGPDASVLDVPGQDDPAAVRSALTPVPRAPSRWVLVLGALMTGLLTGFFGVGGGFLVVPMLVLALGLGMRVAAGTSLLVMIIASLAGLAGRIGTDPGMSWSVTLLFAAGAMAGGLLGGPLSARFRDATLAGIFAGLLGVVAIVVLGDTLLAL